MAVSTLMFVVPQGELRDPHGRGFITHARDDNGSKTAAIEALKDRYLAAGIDVAINYGGQETFCGCRDCRKIDLFLSAKLAQYEGRTAALASCLDKLGKL